MRALPHNCRCFLLFRVFFNARFYYPVLGVLFLDLGLSLQQYAILNAAWAFTIVLLEVPSGALADRLGRRRMVVLAGWLMVAEMALFAFAPAGNATWLFVALLLNRILSGAAEASASGADEALAYDSLAAEGRKEEWARVLEMLMRRQSVAFFFAMILGAALYDAEWVNKALSVGGIMTEFTNADTVRWPLYATLVTSLIALAAALAMREKTPEPVESATTWNQISEAGRWILSHRVALLLILFGMVFDSVIRMVLTFESNYLRFLTIPEGFFGLIGAGLALVGLITAPLARFLTGRFSKTTNFALLGCVTALALISFAVLRTPWAALVLIPIGFVIQAAGFFLSKYLNEAVDPGHRATVLSFKGLAYNLAYGGLGVGYAAIGRLNAPTAATELPFEATLWWFPIWFLIAFCLAGCFGLYCRGKSPSSVLR